MQLQKNEVSFKDERGEIIDILKDKPVEHVTMITSKKGSLRGNHYHKKSWEYTFLIEGKMKVAIRDIDKKKIEFVTMSAGDMFVSPPGQIHALKAEEDSKFMIFVHSPKGVKKYKGDTFRPEENIL